MCGQCRMLCFSNDHLSITVLYQVARRWSLIIMGGKQMWKGRRRGKPVVRSSYTSVIPCQEDHL